MIRMLVITLFVLGVLIFIFVVIDFSENSDDFTDQGATLVQIMSQYYLNYIPEMIRLVSPVAVFIAVLVLTGQMAERFEIVALKAAGISLYRLLIPYLIFSFCIAGMLSYLDGYVIPPANAERIAFEQRYLKNNSDNIDKSRIYRQESQETIMRINYYDANDSVAYNVRMYRFGADSVEMTMDIRRMKWNPQSKKWSLIDPVIHEYDSGGYQTYTYESKDTTLNLLPTDLARSSSDIYQLTYPKAFNYVESIARSGASGINLPRIQLFGRIFYPISLIIVTLIGFSIASVRRRGGKGVYIAAGLSISFLYLALMKIIEPFGASGELDAVIASAIPHSVFLVVGIVLLLKAKK